jgi:hypothetical protein
LGLYEDLLEWSVSRPPWQGDALRRLVVTGALSDEDVDELAMLATGGSAASTDGPRARPLAATDLPASTRAGLDVKVLAIADVANVNALAPGARLDFGAEGLTIVYGDNGTGKSGYVRVLKRVCRARATPERVLPNLMRQDSRPTSAIVEYAVGTDARSLSWHPAMSTTDELGAVSVFDRACAAVYVRAENEVAYRPLGLDLLDSLGDCLQAVRRRVTAEKATLVSRLPSPPPDLVDAPFLHEIWPVSVGHTVSALATAPKWTSDDALKLEQVSRALAAPSPKETAAGLRARRALVTRTQRRVSEIDAAVGSAAVAELKQAHTDTSDAEAALARIRDDALGAEPLNGVGGALWRAMWAAAAEYSRADAHPGRDFPHVRPGASCVLCGQVLSDVARHRFARLRALIETDLSETVDRARTRLTDSRTRLANLASGASDDELVTSLAEVDPALGTSLEAFIVAAKARATELVRWLGTGGDTTLVPLPVGLSDTMDSTSQALADEIDRLERAADPATVGRLRSEARDLQARRWVADNATMISGEILRLARVSAMDAAIATCDTTPVTLESNALTARYVTAQLERDFVHELERLNASRVRIRLAERGERGVTYHRLELDGPGRESARVDDVVSDGEFGAVALASFFAELAESPGRSAIVLDDPVSSLDHRYRQRVALRLVEEAENRQVIVLTHDLVFLHDLQTAAETHGVPVTHRRLRLTTTHVGLPIAEPPWLGMKIPQRIELLQTELNALRATLLDGDLERYEDGAKDWYGLLRETWERAVEEILFVDAVTRYRHEVHTQKLVSSKVWVLDEGDVRELDAGMTKASAWLRGHDQPMAVNQPVPEPDELAADLAVIRDWGQRMRAKHYPRGTPIGSS